MDFRVLGPLEVSSERGAVHLGGPKPRAVLAVLLLHANEPVSSARLVEAVWGEEETPVRRKSLQVSVSRLRKALGDPDVVATKGTTYEVRVRPGELDAERFESLVEEGRRALASGQAEQAAASLREGLALWRGPPLADLAVESFAETDVARLEEQRLDALETRVEADLAAGRHGALVGELRQLVADNPTRERLAGQLMLALYRCGRQAEALEAFRSARQTLVDEIGVEPGPELRRLHEAVLRQDDALDAPRARPDLPRELDAAMAPRLVGREAELGWLRERWEQAERGTGSVVTMTGRRGIGRSRLAAELAADAHRAGATVLYAAGSGPAEATLSALESARGAPSPTLLVVDDADLADEEVLAGLADLTGVLHTKPVLALATGQVLDKGRWFAGVQRVPGRKVLGRRGGRLAGRHFVHGRRRRPVDRAFDRRNQQADNDHRHGELDSAAQVRCVLRVTVHSDLLEWVKPRPGNPDATPPTLGIEATRNDGTLGSRRAENSPSANYGRLPIHQPSGSFRWIVIVRSSTER